MYSPAVGRINYDDATPTGMNSHEHYQNVTPIYEEEEETKVCKRTGQHYYPEE